LQDIPFFRKKYQLIYFLSRTPLWKGKLGAYHAGINICATKSKVWEAEKEQIHALV
jgi:hypothetical protein